MNESPANIAELLEPGTMVDHFRVIRFLGQGGMGQVYLARDTTLGRRVALKVIHRRFVAASGAKESFLFEARATACFSHPNIVTVYAVGEAAGVPYVALEYLEGQNLRARLREEGVSTKQALRIGLAIATALAEAHKNGVLHRDLKPENVLIPPDGRVRVVDFGLALVADREADLTGLTDTDDGNTFDDDDSEEELWGTPGYMAPEQWLGERTSGETDVWAVGIMLFEMLAGQRPFATSTVAELALRVCNATEQMPSLASSAADGDLAELVASCLNKDPTKRPSASDVVSSLRGTLAALRSARAGEQKPFRGLRPFDEEHAHFFLGRDEEIASALEQLRGRTVLPVVGPSGAGKSSLVLAGIIPRLRELGPWMVVRVRPGQRPFSALASALLGARGQSVSDGAFDQLERRLTDRPETLNLELRQLAEQHDVSVLLFVDQLEELYTLAPEQHRRDFMQAICSAADEPHEPLRVVFTLRDDFLVRLAEGAVVGETLSHLMVLRSPGPIALEEILTGPISAVGYSYEDPAMIAEMVAAVEGELAALPLLQFVIRVLWERRDRSRRLLLRDIYEQAGGVGGALARHADAVIDELSPAQVPLARELLLRLVTAEGTRRTLLRDRALEGIADAETVLSRLADGRLVVTGKAADGAAELELAHESLLSTWGRLRRWLEESRSDLVFLAEIEQAAELWRRRGRREEEVWEGAALAEAQQALRRCMRPVPELIWEYIAAARRKQDRRDRRRRIRWWVASGITLAVLVGIAIGSTLLAWSFAGKEREVGRRLAEAQREGARAALLRGEPLEARAKLRSSLEMEDSGLGRALWQRLAEEPLRWRRLLGSSVYDVAFSPDGRTVAAASQDRALYLIDVPSGQVHIIRGSEDQIFSLAFSPDGRHLATGTWSGEVRLWEIAGAKRQIVRVLKQHRGAVWALRFAPDGSRLASAGYDHTICLWDSPGSATTKPRVLRGHTDVVRGLDFDSSGRRLASGSFDGTVRIWDTKTAKQLDLLEGHGERVNGVAFSPDGNSLATGSRGTSVHLWDLASRKAKVLLRQPGGFFDVAFSTDGARLACATHDHAVRVWNIERQAEDPPLSGHVGGTLTVAFSHDGKRLVSGGLDKAVRLWDLRTRRGRPTGSGGHNSGVYGVAFSPDGRLVASASRDSTVRFWSTATGRQLASLHGHDGLVYAIAFSPDGQQLASASADRTIRIWDVTTRAASRVIAAHDGRATAVSYHPRGRMIASAGSSGLVRLWDARNGRRLRQLRGHQRGVYSLAFDPRGELLATASADRTIRVWRVADGSTVEILRGHRNSILGLTFSPNGRYLVSGSDDHTVRIWDRRRPARLKVLAQLPARAYWLDFHPDGKRIGVPMSDGTARLINLAGRTEQIWRGHHAEVNVLAFSADGKLGATSSDDGTVRVWNVADGSSHWTTRLLLPTGDKRKRPQLSIAGGWQMIGTDAPQSVGGQESWRQAVVQSRRGWSTKDGAQLCLLGRKGQIEHWDLSEDKRRFARAIDGEVTAVVALTSGCVAITRRRARLFRGDSAIDLVSNATAAAPAADGFLVAASNAVHRYDASGRQTQRLTTSAGGRALAQLADSVAIGFNDGSVELYGRNGSKRSVSLEDASASAVVSLQPGPMGTVAVGFASGLFGIWELGHGQRLASERLHGPIVHLLESGARLCGASELGDHATISLRSFELSYCELIQWVWRQTPTTWEEGAPVLAVPPEDHRCRQARP